MRSECCKQTYVTTLRLFAPTLSEVIVHTVSAIVVWLELLPWAVPQKPQPCIQPRHLAMLVQCRHVGLDALPQRVPKCGTVNNDAVRIAKPSVDGRHAPVCTWMPCENG